MIPRVAKREGDRHYPHRRAWQAQDPRLPAGPDRFPSHPQERAAGSRGGVAPALPCDYLGEEHRRRAHGEAADREPRHRRPARARCHAQRAASRSSFPAGNRATAYADYPVPIGHGQTISQPYMVAFMTQELSLSGGEKVLEIGTGSGYQAASPGDDCGERLHRGTHPRACGHGGEDTRLPGIHECHVQDGDGGPGWPEEAPFDRILVTAAAPTVPTALQRQLADNGILVVPVGDWRRSQIIVVVRRIGGSFVSQESIGCRFVPLIGEGGFAG